MQLRQLCTHPSLLKVGSNEPLIKTCVNHEWLASSGKMLVLDAMLQEIRSADKTNRVVLVSCFTTTLDVLQKLCDLRGFATTRLDGSTPIELRQGLVNRFNGGTDVCLSSSSFDMLPLAHAYTVCVAR